MNRRTFASMLSALALPAMPAAANEPDVTAFNALAAELKELILAAPPWLRWISLKALQAPWQAYGFEKRDGRVVVVPTQDMLDMIAALREGLR